MEQVLLHQSQVNFHGIWKTGLRVTDDLIKSVGTTALSKPSRRCLLRLTTSGLTLALMSSTEGQSRSHQIAFDSLRDVFINQNQPQCLNIIFLDTEHKFSIMACSSQESDLELICSAFKNRRNQLLTNAYNHQKQRPPPTSQNWTLREKPTHTPESHRISGERYLKSSSSPNGSFSPGGSRESSGSDGSRPVSTSEDLTDEDVFTESRTLIVHEHESLVREPAAMITQRRKGAFDVGVQTVPYVDDYDTESISSTLTLQSISSEISSDKTSNFKTEDISSEKFHHRPADHHGSEDYVTNGHSRSAEDDEFGNSDRGDNHNIINVANSHESNSKNQTDDEKIKELRSVGTQTELSYRMTRRYAKNQRIRTLSNSYRDRAEAIRKKSSGSKVPHSPNPVRDQSSSDQLNRIQSNSDQPNRVQPNSDQPNRVQPNSDQPLAVSSRPPLLGARQRSSATSHSSTPPSQTIRRALSIGSSTVIRPIEQVYQPRTSQRSHSSRARQRPVIVYSPANFNRLA